MSVEIGFLGYGKMAGAISDGLNGSLIPYASQIASNRGPEALERAAAKGVVTAADNTETARRHDFS